MGMDTVGDEVMAITMAGAVVGRWGGEVTIVRQVIGKRAGANPIRTGRPSHEVDARSSRWRCDAGQHRFGVRQRGGDAESAV
jgi:hypothetical protein